MAQPPGGCNSVNFLVRPQTLISQQPVSVLMLPGPTAGSPVSCYLLGGLQGSPGRSCVAGLRVPLILFTVTFILHIKCKSLPPHHHQHQLQALGRGGIKPGGVALASPN